MLEVLPSSDAHNNSRRQVRKNDQDGTKRTKRDRSTSALSPTKPPSKTTRASKVAAATAAASPTKKVATLEDSNSNSNARRRRRHRPGAKDNGTSKGARTKSSKAAASTPPPPPPLELSLEEQERYIAMDCEMVGVGPYGTESALARVTLLNWQGQVVLDAWVRPAQPVTDYRTFVSGITPQDLTDETSPHVLLELDTCRNLVRQQIANKIVIGHALKNDFHALQIYDHPWYLQRDTAKYEPFLQKQDNNNNPAATTSNKSANGSSSSSSCGSSSSSDEATPAFSSSSYYSYNDWHVRRPKARKLKDLVQEKLHRTIQPPGAVHSPIEDALGALDLYKLVRVKWEKCMTYKIAKTQEILLSQHHQEQQQTTLSSSSVEKSDAMLASDHDEVATAASTSQSEDSTFEADYEEFPAEIPVLVVTDNDDNSNNNNDEDDDDEEEDNQDDDEEQLLC